MGMNKQPASVLVTGVSGFIGRYVARHFKGQGWTVIGIDNSPPENAPRSFLSAYYRLHLPDEELHRLLQEHQPDFCIHCAGSASVGLSVTNPDVDFHSNTVVTFEVLDALRRHAPHCSFIFLSSAAVYGNPDTLPVPETQSPNPISPYGFHKWQCEQLCAEFATVYNLPTASVRIFSAYGPGLRRQVVWDICWKTITSDALHMLGTGQESRDFIHPLDITKALQLIVESASMQGEVYNLASGQEVTIEALATMVVNALGYDLSPQFDGIVPPGVPRNWRADISKLRALGFEPSISLQQGIATYAHWCRAELVGV